jgi:signal peptidase II
MSDSRSALRWIYGALALLILILDQGVKQLVVATLDLSERVQLVPGFLALLHTRNTGGAFGILRGIPEGMRWIVFLAVPAVILVLVVWYSLRTPPRPATPQVALALILGGAVGNFLDRLRLGYVVDFVLLHWRDSGLEWPAFNVADSCILVGVFMLCLHLAREEWGERRKERS